MCVKLSKTGCSDASPAPGLVASPWEDGPGLCKAPQPPWGALSQPRSPTAPSGAAALPSGEIYARQCQHTVELSPSRCDICFVALLGEGSPAVPAGDLLTEWIQEIRSLAGVKSFLDAALLINPLHDSTGCFPWP